MRIIFYIFTFYLGAFFAQFFLTGCSEKKVKDFEGAIGKAVEQYSFVDEENSGVFETDDGANVAYTEVDGKNVEVAREYSVADAPMELPAVNDLDCVDVWNDKSIKDWPVTTQLTVTQDAGNLYFSFDKSNSWPVFKTQPDGKPLGGNLWIIVKRDGKTYAQTWEWWVPGSLVKKSKDKLTKDAAGHMKGSWHGWNAVSGETYGWMVSGRIRDGKHSIKERSQVFYLKME